MNEAFDPREESTDARLAALGRVVAEARALTAAARVDDDGEGPSRAVNGEALEAAGCAMVAPLRREDWLFVGPRDVAALLAAGVSSEQAAAYLAGDARALCRELKPRIVGPGDARGAYLAHAFGVAWAMKLRAEPGAVVVALDEEALDAAEPHAALNFAGVFRAPLVVVCRVFVAHHQASREVAEAWVLDRAAAYGLPCRVCDGDDPPAVAASVKGALAHADAGFGPTFIALIFASREPSRDADA